MQPVQNSIPAAAIAEIKNKEDPKELFFKTIREKLDDKIGQEVYGPLFKASLRDCKILDWVSEKDNTYRLILESGYIARKDDNSGKTWYLEKEIVCQFIPENYQIILPKVKALFDANKPINTEEKKLNGIWAWETHAGYVITGVGYSIRWDVSKESIVTDNINDGPWWLPQKFITPQIRTLPMALEEWNQRKKEPVL